MPESVSTPPEVKSEALQDLIIEDETSYGDPQNGIFLAHKNCSRLNPFCKQAEPVVIDFGSSSKRNEGLIPETDIKVRHYEVGILKSMSPKVPEMWFPAALLKVTTPTKPKPGCVVVLAGARGVGKTILALQSMHSDGFENTLNESKVSVDAIHYAYAPAPRRFAECANTIEMLLHPNDALDKWIQLGTLPDLGELRAVFYRRPPPATEDVEASEKLSVVKPLKELFLRRPTKYDSRWRTVIFYDAAGEHFEEENVQVLDQLYGVTDNIAVVIEAASLMPCSYAANTEEYRKWDRVVSVAWEHIDRIQRRSAGRRPRWSLVITKMDEVKDRIDSELWEKIEHFAERRTKSRSGVPDENGEPIDALRELVGKTRTNNQRKLIQRLTGAITRHRPEVFFVWTDGLNMDDGLRILPAGSQGEVPKSYGLAKFIEWCLNESLAVINFAPAQIHLGER